LIGISVGENVGKFVAVSGKVGDDVGVVVDVDIRVAVGVKVAVGSSVDVGCGGALQLVNNRIKSNSNNVRTDCFLHINTFP